MQQINKTLYALNKDNTFQQWSLFVEGNKIIVKFGKYGGKIQTKETICEPKNIGRANETSAEEQALLEAISKWEKQVRLGYRETTEELETGNVLSVMLAADATKKSHMIIYPCYVQPKLDGLRCLVTFDEGGNPTFNSRGNKTYPIKGKIIEQVKDLSNSTGFKMLDGEVYLHGLTLQKISSLAKKWRTHDDIAKEIQKDFEGDNKRRDKAIANGESTYKDFNKDDISVEIIPVPDVDRYGGYESADLQFHVFDVPSKDKPWYTDSGLNSRLGDFLLAAVHAAARDLTHVHFVRGDFYSNEQEVKDSIAVNMQKGYEGSIIRNSKGIYEFGQRSNDLLKWKIFQSDECVVTGYVIDKNNEAVLEGITKSGKKFSFKMKGTFKDRNEAAAKRLIGKFVTFTFQTLTDGGIPLFPVGQYQREVNLNTWEPEE